MLNIDIYLAVFFESIAIFMSLFFFIQYSILKKNEYLFYAFYLLSLAVYYLIAIPQLFFNSTANDADSIYNLFKRPVQFLSSVFYTYFIIYYLGLKNKSASLYRFFNVLNITYLLLAVSCLLLNFFRIQYRDVYYIVNYLLLPVQIYMVLTLFKHKVPYSKYIISGTLVILIGSAVTLGISVYGSRHAIPGMAHSIHLFLPVQLSIFIDMFLFTIALQKKIADNERSLINAAYQRQEAIMLERERIIADLHDDVGGGLSSIRMMSDLIAEKGNNINEANTNSFAQKISVTAKDIAQRMHTIIWSLNVENDTLENFVEYVRQYGISFFENSGVNFKCTTGLDFRGDIQLKGVVRKNLFLIMKESFHNILKHARANNISVNISIVKNSLQIEVKDDGSGIVNPNHFGNGLKNMKKRMDEIGGNLVISSDKGTSIVTEVEVK